MVAAGKPLWYLQMATTGAVCLLTLFFISVMASWHSGIDEILEDATHALEKYPEGKRGNLLKYLADFTRRISGSTFYFPLVVGFTVGGLGSAFSYSLYKEKAKELFGLVWFGLVCSFTLVWMVTSIIFYVDVTFIGKKFNKEEAYYLEPPLSTLYSWGRENATGTALWLIVVPTLTFIFLSFASYRLYVKLSVFGNANPDIVGEATETKPGSWFDRQTGAEGGTWQREEEKIVAPGSLKQTNVVDSKTGIIRPEIVVVELDEKKPVLGAANVDQVGGAELGNWLEDVFDYTF